MIISVEVPVVAGAFLIPCVESVLKQSSRNWRLSLLWDKGDELSLRILEKLAAQKHPQIQVFLEGERRGIAPAREFLSQHSEGDWILTLDHDDLLHPDAVKKFLAAAEQYPWASLIRARRGFVDGRGAVHPMDDWFPFEPRHYFRGMATDVYNHSQPTIIWRSAYAKTSGWEGFPEYKGAGEDCDMILKCEEHGEVALLDDTLYYYRIHGSRTSNDLGAPAAEDMWRRLADKTIARRQLPLLRENETQPFVYRDIRTPVTTPPSTPPGSSAGVSPSPALARSRHVDVVVAFYEADEEELPYPWRRPSEQGSSHVILREGVTFSEQLAPQWLPLHRVEASVTSPTALHARLTARLLQAGRVLAEAHHHFQNEQPYFENVSFSFPDVDVRGDEAALEFSLDGKEAALLLHTLSDGAAEHGLLRLYQHAPGSSRKSLERCLRSLRNAGIADDAIHVIEQRASAAANRNAGMWKATREFVCFVDDDVEVLGREVFEQLLDASFSIGADLLGPKLLDGEDRIYCAAPYFDAEGFPKPRGLGEEDKGQFDFRARVPWLPSTCLLMRRAVALAAPPWNEDYTGSQLEDVDFCLQARSRGFECAYVGDAAVRHYNLQRNYRFSLNLPYYRARWKGYPELFQNLAE